MQISSRTLNIKHVKVNLLGFLNGGECRKKHCVREWVQKEQNVHNNNNKKPADVEVIFIEKNQNEYAVKIVSCIKRIIYEVSKDFSALSFFASCIYLLCARSLSIYWFNCSVVVFENV